MILDYLKAIYGDRLDAGLDIRTRAEAHALRRLMEEHLYWCAVYDRWAVNENWALTKPAFFGALPPAVRDLVAALARRGQLRALRGHGVGRHTSGGNLRAWVRRSDRAFRFSRGQTVLSGR